MSVTRRSVCTLLVATGLWSTGVISAKPPLVPKLPQLNKPSPFEGTWANPAVKLVVEKKGGRLSGSILFTPEKQSKTDSEAQPVPLLAPRIRKNKELTFEIWKPKIAGSPDYGPNKHYRFTLDEDDVGLLEEIETRTPGATVTLKKQAQAQDAQR